MKQRFYTLDFLKFIAAIVILMHHWQNSTQLELGAGNGWLMVELFFVISGFLAVNSIKKVREQSLKKFLANKISRLYPMAIITAIGYAVCDWIYFRITGSWYRTVDIGLWNLLASGLLVFQGGAIGNIDLGANNQTWYLCVLLICYMIYFGLVKLASKLKISPIPFFVGMILIGLSVNTYGISRPFFNSLSARGYFAFFFGAVLYYVIAVVPKRKSVVISLLVLIVVSLPKLFHFPELYDSLQMIATFIVYPAVIILCINSKLLNKIFSNKISGYLGGVSFEIYLWHGTCLALQGLLLELGVIPGVSYKLFLAFGMGVFLISCFMYSFVEKKLYKKMYGILNDFFDKIAKVQ